MSTAPRRARGAGSGDRRDRDGEHPEDGARHGIAAPRGLGARPGAPGARFTTMFPYLPRRDAGECAIEALVGRMHEVAGVDTARNRDIPAGFTYLGQFIDHDITYDATSRIDGHNVAQALVNFRTPRLDLDSLYGSGPADQPFLYDWRCGVHRGAKLLVGHNPPDPFKADDDQPALIDLPRNEQGRALIGDPRNDEHLIISQLHLLFIQFHNRVVEEVHRELGLTGNELFDEAVDRVRWHYQWIVMTEFLRKVVGSDLWQSLSSRLASRSSDATQSAGRDTACRHEAAIPVEFSAAAYRFGHSMVRSSYTIKIKPDVTVNILPPKDPSDPPEPHLGGFRRLPDALTIDWAQFFGATASPSRRIDHVLTLALFTLPPDDAALARLNLHRGRALGLPVGNDVARAMGEDPLRDNELLPKDFWPLDHETVARDAILAAPPLWFYVLREADVRGPGSQHGHLGPVGGRIVAEVLIGLLEADQESYLHQPGWKPTLGDRYPAFEMTDLVDFVQSPPNAPDS